MEDGGGTNQQGGNVTNSRKTSKHRQTKRQATGCRPVDQSASSTPAERQRSQQSGREASRAAEKPADRHRPAKRQKDRQNGKKTGRTTKQQKLTAKCFTWNNGEHQKLSTEKKICREILIVCRQMLIVGEDQRGRFFLFL
ncbi:hypothetical protein [Thiolapillus sp.]|uniref:hypothetical protein n=1 Tax=Thiolapillus sp. TaxID=2017437 RepID=UPI003AF90626